MLKPSRYRIITIGKARRGWIQNGLNLYLKRLPGLTITELRNSTPQKEAQSIQAALKKDEVLIVLTEEGETVTSNLLARRLQDFGSMKLAFVLGGADGLTSELKDSANWKLSLSTMTFPHEIALLTLVEQIYRAQTIVKGGPYHRE